MYSALQKHHKMAALLLDHGAGVNEQDSQGLTAVMMAIQSESLKTVSLMLDAHPDLTLQGTPRSEHTVALKRNVLSAPEWSDEFGQSALLFAAKKNYHNHCARMIQNGAQIDCQSNNGLSSLSWASFLGHLPVVNTLLQFAADPNLETQHGSTALSFAAESGHCRIISNLIDHKADLSKTDHDGDTPMHCAAHSGHLDAVKLLHSKGADLAAKNKNNQTPLDYAALRNHRNVVDYLTPLTPNAYVD